MIFGYNLMENHFDGSFLGFRVRKSIVILRHYPLGVLYDMYASEDNTLPWRVNIRLKVF